MSQTPSPTRFIGCDVAKREIVVFDSHTSKTRRLENTPEALAAFAGELDEGCLVICEATGGHEAALLEALLAAGIPAHRADARKVKAFIRSFGTLAKSDSIDARALAQYGRERHERLARWRAPERERTRLQSLVATRRSLINDRTAYSNRLSAPGGGSVAPYLEDVLACLDRQIAAIEAEIKSRLKSCNELDRTKRVLTRIPGIGATTAAELIALMPELGSLTRREAASLAGLAPHPKDSGAAQGHRYTKGGRRNLKRSLFMAALSAGRHNPTLRAVKQRLKAQGKKSIVAQTAIMRRLIVIANAKIRDEFAAQPYPQN